MAGIINVPVSQPSKAPAEERRTSRSVKIKSLGRPEIPSENFRAKLEAQRRNLKQDQERQEAEQRAETHRKKIISRLGSKRHLEYDVIEDTAIVQVRVVNSEDGTVIRKYPPDKVIEFARNFKKSRKEKLDMKL